MNKIIQVISRMAKNYTDAHFGGNEDVTDDEFTKVYNQKLAELIIKECSSIAWWAEQYNMGDGVPISLRITQHFGVE